MEDFLGMTSAFIRRVGQDVKAKGYSVIFTDVGPHSLEKEMPEMFKDLAKKSSGNGVQVRGFSRATKQAGAFRDSQTGEKGVGLWILDIKDDGQGRRIGTGSWSEGEGSDKWHEVKYRLIQQSGKWKAE